jgi:hypothetical protein
MAEKRRSTKPSTDTRKSNPAVSYDEFKEYEGQRYTGMKIGRSHKWHYDRGDWKETKITPDLWQVSYAVTKRRAGRAPEGSGVPVGTEYHWYVLAHQNVAKQTANDYTTSLTGLKFKIAHKRAGSEKWSATPMTQRKRMIKFLQSVIADLEKQNVIGADVLAARGTRTPTERRATRARRSTAKPPARAPHRAKRVSARRRATRATSAGRGGQAKVDRR